jgi:hypothetical protein
MVYLLDGIASKLFFFFIFKRKNYTLRYLETVVLIAQAFEMSFIDVLAYPDKYMNINELKTIFYHKSL